MATRKDHPVAPGAYASNGVRCTMDPPFDKGKGKGSQQTMGGPFNAPRAGGDNGLPTKVYDTAMGGPSATPKPGYAAQAPSAQGPTRKGTR